MIECKECERVFDKEETVRRHVKVHGLSYEQYYLKWVCEGTVPLCACGCGKETVWHVARKSFNEFVHGHHAFGRKKSDEEKAKIGHANSINQKRLFAENPELGKQRSKVLRSGITPESEIRRIEATKQAYANMSDDDKEKFSENATRLWESGLMEDASKRGGKTRHQKFLNGEYDLTERNEKISRKTIENYRNGSINWKTGDHYSPKMNRWFQYRASYEPIYMKMLDEDDDVMTWEYEFASIPYQFENATHLYLPDFHVVRVGERHEFVEVKPIGLRTIARNVAKREVALEFCKEHNWIYIEWSLEEEREET